MRQRTTLAFFPSFFLPTINYPKLFPFLSVLCVINKCLAGLTIFLFCAAIEVELNCIKMQISVVIQIEKEM